ncbi:DUF6473 family protein [uncultured Roseobacter sp.]|uniref:DUF6473 family protein n=1 Tax=uncultured Roseobacter sp. TaxID=114847 RepID=UPI002634195D|nr:DUF6473 family protein [uncultured Roseobacter sp.]
MSYDVLGAGALDYMPCHYGRSKLTFRGPERRLDVPYVAFLGGTATYGKFLKTPFPALVESTLGVNCVNLGIANAGLDVMLKDPFLRDACFDASATVIQVVGAHNLSNRFYTVHPRRNDRFLTASERLMALYPEVDFAEFHFNKHMLSALYNLSRERFAKLCKEVRAAWVARMRQLTRQTPGRVVLVWFSHHAPPSEQVEVSDPGKGGSPLFITREMLDTLYGDVADCVELVPSAEALAAGSDGMIFDQMEAPAAKGMLGPRAHGELAQKLEPVLQRLI